MSNWDWNTADYGKRKQMPFYSSFYRLKDGTLAYQPRYKYFLIFWGIVAVLVLVNWLVTP